MLGPDLPATPSNPAGHYESASLVEVNEQLLRWAGSSWDRPFVVRPAWEDPKSLKLLARLRTSLGGHAVGVGWIDKDPRLCLTRDAVSHLLLSDPAAIAVVREPLAVATSLYRRDGFSLRKGAAIWLLYNLHLFNSHSRPPESIILFDDLVSPEDKVQKRVAQDLAAFTVAAFGEKPGASTGTLEKQALSELGARRRSELVRGDNHWRDEQHAALIKSLEDIWLGYRDLIRSGTQDQVAPFLRNAWAAVSPILEPEVATPLDGSPGPEVRTGSLKPQRRHGSPYRLRILAGLPRIPKPRGQRGS